MSAVFLAMLGTGARYALLGVGFGLVISVFRYFSISYAAIVIVAAYSAYLANRIFHLPVGLTAVCVVAVGVAASVAHCLTIDKMRHLVRDERQSLFMFVTTGALFVIVQNSLLIVAGPGSLYSGLSVGSPLAAAVYAIIAAVGMHIFLAHSHTGLTIRATADSGKLARIAGLNIDRIELITSGLAGVCAGAAGLLVASNQDLRFSMGADMILAAALCGLVGGGARPLTVAAIGFLIGAIDAASVWVLSSGVTDLIMAFVLLGAILVAPRSVSSVLQQRVRDF
jgi:branched-chain amino acid transport system permease protein